MSIKRRNFFLSFICCLILLFHFSSVSASRITINIDKENVIASIHSSIYQNITSLPEIEIYLDEASLPSFKIAVENGIREKISEASVKDLNFSFKQNKNWINISGNFEVLNVAKKEGGNSRINCGWKSFKVVDELSIRNISFNKVGLSILIPLLKDFSEMEGVKFYFPLYTSITYIRALEILGNVSLLNFEPLEIPVQEWERIFDKNSLETSWYMSPRLSAYLGIEVSDLNKTINYLVASAIDAQIFVPGYAYAEGDAILFDLGEGKDESIMITAIAVLAFIGITGYFIGRKFT